MLVISSSIGHLLVISSSIGHLLIRRSLYLSSAVNKSRMKMVALLHFALFLLSLAKVSPSLLRLMSIRPPKFILDLRLPAAEPWEYIWLFSIHATIFALIALPKNRSFLMKQYMIGTLIFGFVPITYAVYQKANELLEYVTTRQTTKAFRGFPVVVLWYMFFTVVVQVQGFGIYFAKQLISAWAAKGMKKKAK